MGNISFTVNPDSRLVELSNAIKDDQRSNVRGFQGTVTAEGGITLFPGTPGKLSQALTSPEGLEAFKANQELVYQAFSTLLTNDVLHNGGTLQQAETLRDQVLQNLSLVNDHVIQKSLSPHDITPIQHELRSTLGLYTPTVEQAVENQFDEEYQDLRELAKAFTQFTLERIGNIEDVQKAATSHLCSLAGTELQSHWPELKEQVTQGLEGSEAKKAEKEAAGKFREAENALFQHFGYDEPKVVQKEFRNHLAIFLNAPQNEPFRNDIAAFIGGAYPTTEAVQHLVADTVLYALAEQFGVSFEQPPQLEHIEELKKTILSTRTEQVDAPPTVILREHSNPDVSKDNLLKRRAQEISPQALDKLLASPLSIQDRAESLLELTKDKPHLLAIPRIESAVSLAQSIVDSTSSGKLTGDHLSQLDHQIKAYLSSV